MELPGNLETLVNLVPLGVMGPKEVQDLWDRLDQPDPREMKESGALMEIWGIEGTSGLLVTPVNPERREVMDFPAFVAREELPEMLVPKVHRVLLESEKELPAKKVNLAWTESMDRMVTGAIQGPQGPAGLRVRQGKTEPLESMD